MVEMLNGFALDLGGTKLAAARFANGKLAQKAQMPTQANADFEQLTDNMEELLAGLGFQKGDRLGVALTGRLDQQGYWSAVNGGTLPKINNIDVRTALIDRFGTYLTILNDAAAAACGEAHFGVGRGVDIFGYITISTGVGGGIVLKGQPLTSPNGLAGHIGFMRSPIGEQLCGSGRFGTVESVAGGRAIALQAQRAGHADCEARDVFLAHQQGQAWASIIVSRAAQAIAIQIADLTSIFGLGRVAVGGSIGLAQGFIPLIKQYLVDEPELFRPEIAPAALGGDSPLYGVLTG
ncbi:ROK family protein [Maritalea mediterranea]|uniref:ROK family protein n=1 Tax=Maritalea mediterranea TaxID=2909667 RepID=A0ABS9E337_9HYPH|nr:ROK family protein [Maritalea mediterranea]MCF4097281.1 ROK family protein [Maritalea mediterranea]